MLQNQHLYPDNPDNPEVYKNQTCS